jgi:hypothetical protein
MATLRIEHPITDFTTWQTAFARLSGARAAGGVLAARIYRPVDDPQFVLIDLDFAGVDQAQAFRDFLHSRVWSIADTAPALAGAPLTRIVEAEPVPAQPTVSVTP